MQRSTLIVGIGSHHGDDQIGWHVAEQLVPCVPPPSVVRMAASPSQLLDWLDGIERLVVCDACCGSGEPGSIGRWQWPAHELHLVKWQGTHDVSLSAALSLAQRLGRLPAEVVIWSVEVAGREDGQTLSDPVAAALPALVQRIERELAAACWREDKSRA